MAFLIKELFKDTFGHSDAGVYKVAGLSVFVISILLTTVALGATIKTLRK